MAVPICVIIFQERGVIHRLSLFLSLCCTCWLNKVVRLEHKRSIQVPSNHKWNKQERQEQSEIESSVLVLVAMVIHANENEQEKLIAVIIHERYECPYQSFSLAAYLVVIFNFITFLHWLDFFSRFAHEHNDGNEQEQVDEECVSASWILICH